MAKKDIPEFDPKVARPKTIGAAKKLINDTFAAQPLGGWNEREQAVFFEMVGVSGKEKPEDVRRIIEVFENARMVLFREGEKDGNRIKHSSVQQKQ